MSNIEKQLERMKKEIWADVDWKDNYSKALVYLNYYMDENDKLSLENVSLKETLAEKDARIAELQALVAKLEDDADFLAKELDIVDAKALELQRALKGGL